MASDSFPALPGFYRLLFLYLEPVSTFLPALIIYLSGATWFHHQLVPTNTPAPSILLDDRTNMTVWQLGNCYFLLGLMSSFVFRAIRDTLPNNPAAQERILGASFTALGIADLTHVFVSIMGLPPSIRYNVTSWNATTHGNTTITIFLFLTRLSWYLGIGRTRYYFGRHVQAKTTKL